MPENQTPATKPEATSAPEEFNFAGPASETSRIRRRSLKGKQGGLIKPAGNALPAARELEREAPPLSAAQASQPKAREVEEVKPAPAAKAAEAATAPPRTTPSPATSSALPASSATTAKSAATTSQSASVSSPAAKPALAAAATPATSPHGTRPATLYYSSSTRKEEPTPTPMKTAPAASTPSPSSSASATMPTSIARSATASPRPATSVDYRANVDRQSREQKSVGSLLSYVVYGLIAFFVISAILAGYGADVIFKQLHDQSMTVSDLDARYAEANKDLTAKLATTQDTLTQAQAQIGRQQDLIVKQQEELNKLIAATNDNESAIKLEKSSRAQETVNLRARVRDLENSRGTSTQKY
jgi:hypothetical protein